MLVVDTLNHSVITEIGKEMPLSLGPEGMHKRIEIGVNNYSPSIFLSQYFRVYFVKDSFDYSSGAA